ncbi:MAG: HigA family addiction module antidote protein [Bacteroidales bacterium]|nr:HigA family addiction module antidote protein [Bacteroidales bacterium]
MNKEYNYTIEHPGAVFMERLQELGMSVKEFAVRAGKPEKTVIDVIKGRSAVSPEMALLIEYVTGMSAEMLLRWQSEYDAQQARTRMAINAEDISKWMSLLPVEDIVKNGWVPALPSDGEMADSLLRFFGVVSPKAWEAYYFRQRLRVAFNVSIKDSVDPYALSAWLRRGELQAQDIILDTPYSPRALKDKLPEIQFVLNNPPDDVMDFLKEILAGCGVKLIYTEPLPSVTVKGATRWIGGCPCIQLLNATDAYENYAYTIFHEIAHILLHGRKDVFLEEDTPSSEEEYLQKEAEADAFARKWLLM